MFYSDPSSHSKRLRMTIRSTRLRFFFARKSRENSIRPVHVAQGELIRGTTCFRAQSMARLVYSLNAGIRLRLKFLSAGGWRGNTAFPSARDLSARGSLSLSGFYETRLFRFIAFVGIINKFQPIVNGFLHLCAVSALLCWHFSLPPQQSF